MLAGLTQPWANCGHSRSKGVLSRATLTRVLGEHLSDISINWEERKGKENGKKALFLVTGNGPQNERHEVNLDPKVWCIEVDYLWEINNQVLGIQKMQFK